MQPSIAIGDEPRPVYRITLTLSIDDAHELWSAAAAHAMQFPGMRLQDALDIIGPREDPSIEDCLALLASPPALAGCTPSDFEVERAAPLPLDGAFDAVGCQGGPAKTGPFPTLHLLPVEQAPVAAKPYALPAKPMPAAAMANGQANRYAHADRKDF